MSYTFRVLFSGLCAFVPNKPFEQLQEPPTEVTVLLQNLIHPRPLDLSVEDRANDEGADDEEAAAAQKPTDVLEPHYPLVEFDLPDLHPQSSRKPDLSRDDIHKGACFLFGEEVSFDLNLKNGKKRRLEIPNDPKNQPERNQEVETKFDKESLYWLSRLDKAAPGNFVKPKLLTDPLSLTGKPTILSRMKLTHGYLRVSKLSDKVVEFHPLDPDRPYRQKIATELALDITGVTGPAVVVCRNPDGLERRLTLTPVTSPGLVVIRIHNRELDNLLGIPQNLLPPQEKADFEVFYHLVDSTNAGLASTVRQRIPRQVNPPDGVFLVNPSLCPPTALAAA